MSITCHICLNDVHDCRTLSCGHLFCRGCINTWLSSHDTCPTCRHDINQRSCIINNIGKKEIHTYTTEKNLISEPITIVKGQTTIMTESEKLFIFKMHGFRIEDRFLDLSLDSIFVCIVKNNTITFGKKVKIDQNTYYLKDAFTTIRNTGVTFPLTPENRIFDDSFSEYAYACI